MTSVVLEGNCIKLMQNFEDNTFDSIVTDPPYGLSFMGKDWDHGVPGTHFWQEILRVAKPGAHMLAFGGTRTHHRLMVAIEDAEWEIRDTLGWIYGSGFPKSLDVSKAIEAKLLTGSSNKTQFKNLDGEKGVTALGYSKIHADNDRPNNYNNQEYTKTVTLTTDAAKQWNGWGTSLKPAWEPIILCRKPLEGTVAENVQKWGTGGINIDGCRIALNGEKNPTGSAKRVFKSNEYTDSKIYGDNTTTSDKGRFPANLIHDGSDEVLALFPESKGQCGDVRGTEPSHTGDENSSCYGVYGRIPQPKRNDSGSAARFFYCAKASKSERNLGLPAGTTNNHPTVKPLALLQYLCRLTTPPGGLILDPFAGSGTTGVAANREGFNSILMEVDPNYVKIAKRSESSTL